MEEVANNVARAIAAALDWNSPAEVRNNAVAFLESFKSGEIHVLANTSVLLIRKEWPSEIRLHGLKMLQHLVRFRWDEFSAYEREQFANVTVSLISDMIDPNEQWALKSQVAALVAEVVRREGLPLWHKLLPALVSLSEKGPIEAELVAIVLRWLPEDITVHNEDLEGDRRRTLLRGLTESLPEILPLLCSLLEKHYGVALGALQTQQSDIAQRHAVTVFAIINAINAYADWAPVDSLAKYGLIHGCGFLLSSEAFRLHACEFFKLICQRRKPADATTAEFNSAMCNIFEILMDISANYLKTSFSKSFGVDESEDEFIESICESMVALGISQLHCISGNADLVQRFLQQMLDYFKHYKFALHFQSLHFWLTLTRESIVKQRAPAHSSKTNSSVTVASSIYDQTDKDKRGVFLLVNDDMFATILHMCFQRMVKRSQSTESIGLADAFELWSEEFDGKIDFSQYRSRLLELIKLVTSQKPIIAVATLSQRIEGIIKGTLHHSISPQELALLESLQVGLETVVSTGFDGPSEYVSSNPEIKFQLQGILGGLLNHLLMLKWSEPASAVLLGRYLDAYGPYLKYTPDAISSVINKLFELLTSLPLTLKETSLNSSRHARLQICQSFIRIARAADASLLPYGQTIADTMAYLEREGLLLRGEHNVLGEAFLVMASSAGIQKQQEVLNWLLEPLSEQWKQSEWQSVFLCDPLCLSRMLSDMPFSWSIFHTVTFFEKALKRSGVKKPVLTLSNTSTSFDSSANMHPMSSHLEWMLPPLLKLLRAIHSLWSPHIHQALTSELRAAKCMSQVEQAGLLGEGTKQPKGQLSNNDGTQEDMHREESNENGIRNWLKSVRDSGYNVLGLSTTIGDHFFRCLDSSSFALALMENIQSMEFRHIRLLIHSVVIPLIKHCPSDLWQEWLENILSPLFLHCQQALTCSWASLLREGRAKVPDKFGDLSGLELKIEVMEEKLLRDLTREICNLLSVLASPTLNSGLPTLEQLGNTNRMEASLPDLAAFSSNSLVSFVLSRKDLAIPALRICLRTFTWTDSEAVTKIASFCGTVIILSISTNNSELRQFVAKDMFSSVIESLALESNAIISAELVGICREIFVYLSDRDPAPRQVLMSLPYIKIEDLLAFEDALTKTASPKEQKQHMRSLLQLATGNTLKSLAAQKPATSITNVTAKSRHTAATPVPGLDEDSPIGLAAIT